jgi:glycosyltransferase involved in cell wall biosynthesis
MRIGLITKSPVWGGTEVHTAYLANALASAGHTVLLFQVGHRLFSEATARLDIRAQIIDLPGEPSALALHAALRRHALDAGVLVKGGSHLFSLRKDFAMRRACRRLVAIEHLPRPLPPRASARYVGGRVPGAGLWWYRQRFEVTRRSYVPDCIICVSDAVRGRLVDEYRYAPGKTLTVRNGVDLDAFRRDRELGRRFLGDAIVRRGARVIGALGRFVPQKGYDLLLPALADAGVAGRPDIQVVIVGDGPSAADIHDLARRLSLEDVIEFRPFSTAPVEAYSGFDVFVLPSRNEGLPLTLLEAMACECPVVATAVGGVPEVLAHEGAGWMIPSEDHGQLTGALRSAMDTPGDQLAVMARRAREIVATHFDLHVQMAKIVKIVEETARGVRA